MHARFVNCSGGSRRKKPSLPAVLLICACAGGVDAAPRNLHVLTTDNRIATVPESRPDQATTAIAVAGLNAGDNLVAIDVRAQNGRLYGLGYNGSAGSVQLYHLTLQGGMVRANAVGTTGGFVNALGAPVFVFGTEFGIDFNPVTDRLRVNTDSGQNFRINPNTGSFVDGDLAGGAGSVPGVNMDGPIGGGTVVVQDAASSNNVINAAVTTLYTIDSLSNVLWIQNPPNAGTQTSPLLVTLGGSPLDFGTACGLDLPLGVDTGASSTPAVGMALAALSVAGDSGLYRIDLGTGSASLMGSFGLAVRDIAVAVETATAHLLSSDGFILQRRRVANPAAGPFVLIGGTVDNERLVGIDGRPATGQLIGFGVNAATNTGSLYVVDPQTGLATPIGNAGSIAFVDAGGATVDLPEGSWGVDFNPVVDRIRVTSGSGLNFRLNPISGAPLDGDLGGAPGSVAGVNPDGAINGAVGIGPAGAAHANNFAGATGTTLYTLDTQGNRLFIQNPPNNGTQVAVRAISLDGLPFDVDVAAGFDIPPGVNAPNSGAEAAGEGYAVLGIPGGALALYRIDLPTGAVQPIGPIASVPGVEGLAVWAALSLVLFSDSFEADN